jgi:hypothetical protein
MNGRVVLAIVVVTLNAGACAPDGSQATPYITDSAEAAPRWTIDINRVLDGIFRTYRPRCLDTVRAGHTVELRNFQPDVPANVTALASPDGVTPLYSPNLMWPYNYVGRDDPDNDLCEIVAVDRSCSQRPHWSYWRYTFEAPGVYDWIDTNSGGAGRQVVDPYYGTVTFVGLDPSTPFGTVCVQDELGGGCDSVCCFTDADCQAGQSCFRSTVDAVGRCLTPSG